MSNDFTLTFDAPLVPGVLNPAALSFRYSNDRHQAADLTVDVGTPTVAYGASTLGAFDPGPHVATYAPPPSALVGQSGSPVEPFEIPLTPI